MRPFLYFLLVMAAALVASAALTYPAWLLVLNLGDVPLHRVMHRLAMLFTLLGLIVLLRHLRLGNRETLGYGIPRRDFLRQLALGFIAGLIVMLPLVGCIYGLELRYTRPDFDAARIISAIGAGLLTGFTVAFVEETFFRGAMYAAIQRTSGTWLAIILTSLVYASLHFVGGKLKIPTSQVDWSSGFLVLAHLFERYADPRDLIDSLLALIAVGIFLALVRTRTGSIAAGIGLHAGWVCVITVLRTASVRNSQAHYASLVGSYDGVIGWLALAWIAVFAILYWVISQPAGSAANDAKRQQGSYSVK